MPHLTDHDLRVRITSRVPAEAGKISLASLPPAVIEAVRAAR